jgi:hypothetical protein
LIKFVLESYSFKRILIITVIFLGFTYASSKLFDLLWGSRSSIPIINLEDVYRTPVGYNDFPSVNFKLSAKDNLNIEGNKKFKIKQSGKDFSYYDTVIIQYPDTTFEFTNKIYMQFEGSDRLDSIFLVVSKSEDPKIFYKQIFFSSVKVHHLNEFSSESEGFRLKKEDLVPHNLLEDNDSLINVVFKYFNDNKDTLGLAECGRNSEIFHNICFMFNLPCRIISLQGGDADQAGYYNYIGYPLHVVCEIYSSKYNKWYVVDPSFGLRFRHKGTLICLNAVEMSTMYLFGRDGQILQDSILFTKRTVVGRDYFKYYENIYYKLGMEHKLLRKILRVLYPEFNYYLYHFSNNYPPIKNGFYYVGVKTFMYFFISILYINSVMFVFIKRLVKVKKPKS